MIPVVAGNGMPITRVGSLLRDTVKARHGDWVITLVDENKEMIDGRWPFCFGVYERIVTTKVTFTEAEFNKMHHLVRHGLAKGAKMSDLLCTLEYAGIGLWPTGSVDHVAMRHFGPAAMMRYVSQAGKHNAASTSTTRCFSAMAGNVVLPPPKLSRVVRKEKAAVKKTESIKEVPPPTKSDDGGSDADLPSPEGPPAAVGPPDGGHIPNRSGGFNATATATLNQVDVSGVTMDLPGGIGVKGAEWHTGVNADAPQVRGLLIGPVKEEPLVYAATPENVEGAIGERIGKKQRAYLGTKADKEKIGQVTREAIGNDKKRGIFSKERIKKWAEENGDLKVLKSSKWGDARFMNSVDNLLGKPDPKFEHAAGIKAEGMPKGKAPRLIIADGDAGQLMALLAVACFEHLLFEHQEARSIKHATKKTAMKRIIKMLTKRKAGLVEGDGSAWDTTCGDEVRASENTILTHIIGVLADYGISCDQWDQAHLKACSAKEIKLLFKTKDGPEGKKRISFYIDAIRRSGHRGTSCLNWWANFVNWICSIFKEPKYFLDPDRREGTDVTGKKRWWSGGFEGDDSLCSLYPKMEKGDELSKKFLEWWERQGFNMKIVFCKSRATFVGWHIGCDAGTPNGYAAPELARALGAAGLSTSPTIIQAAKDGDTKVVKEITAASYIARAHDFAGLYPSVSNKFLDYAKSLGANVENDREMSMRCKGHADEKASTLISEIEQENVQVTPDEEMMNLQKLGAAATIDEIDKFMAYHWVPSEAREYASYRDSLPPTWR